jgi:hypothetical protein
MASRSKRLKEISAVATVPVTFNGKLEFKFVTGCEKDYSSSFLANWARPNQVRLGFKAR